MTDTYTHADRSTPLFCTVLADHAEQWEPLPFPEAPHMDLPRHLWSLAGEHGSAHTNGSFPAHNVIVSDESDEPIRDDIPTQEQETDHGETD